MIPSEWPAHTRRGAFEKPLDARRCTVQLSTGRLYLDALATPETALLGHDLPPADPRYKMSDPPTAQRLVSSLAPGYVCLALLRSLSAALDWAAQMSSTVRPRAHRVLQSNALDGEPAPGDHILLVDESQTLARTGRWLASPWWKSPPEFIVLGEVLALGSSVGAVLVRCDLVEKLPASIGEGLPSNSKSAGTGALERLATAITTVENEGLLEQGREVADYLASRLGSVRRSCPQIASLAATGLCIRVGFAAPLEAKRIRRRMCERGVLAGVDQAGRLALDPPLPLRIAEADVIVGALRGAILDLPLATAAVCCAACENSD